MMKLMTQLIHFDAQVAVCLASLEQGETHVSVYASAQAHEAGNYPDLAQQRALQLAWRLQQDGLDVLRSLNISTPIPASAIPSSPQAFQNTIQPSPTTRSWDVEIAPVPDAFPPDDEKDAPSATTGRPW